MGNQQPSTYRNLTNAVVNARIGDGSFWKHPECQNHKIIWSSICEDWVRWKLENFLPAELRGSVSKRTAAQRAQDGGVYQNAEDIWSGTSLVHPLITKAQRLLDPVEALHLLTREGLGAWFLDNGCSVKRNDTSGGYRVSIAIGAVLSPFGDELLTWARERFQTEQVGRVYKNNSRATELNKSWIIPKTVALQVMQAAREISPTGLLYKVPIW